MRIECKRSNYPFIEQQGQQKNERFSQIKTPISIALSDHATDAARHGPASCDRDALTEFAMSIGDPRASPCNQKQCKTHNAKRLRNRSSQRGRGQRLIEVEPDGIEVKRIDDAVVVKIALERLLARASAEICRQRIEVGRVDDVVDVGILGQRLANQLRRCIDGLSGEACDAQEAGFGVAQGRLVLWTLAGLAATAAALGEVMPLPVQVGSVVSEFHPDFGLRITHRPDCR